jgi:F-type H+-transporting ATPase subunit a
MIHDPDPFDHVLDTPTFHLFHSLFGDPVEINLPVVFGLQITKYMILELVAAGLILAIFIPLCRKAATGQLPRGAWWNAFESLLTFVRDKIARPNLGEHDGDRFTPFLWTLFLFILFCNLLGMIPMLGSPTASIYVTGGLAFIAFLMLHVPAMIKMGVGHYFQALWPHIDVKPAFVGWGLSFFIFVIELAGTFIKSGVLAVRLFANMLAGHLALAMILIFIYLVGQSAGTLLWGTVTVASVLGQVALSLLELFVAFLQAYVFTFLTALFMGMSLHPQH